MSEKTVSMTIFTDFRPGTFILPESMCVFIPWAVFWIKFQSDDSKFVLLLKMFCLDILLCRKKFIYIYIYIYYRMIEK